MKRNTALTLGVLLCTACPDKTPDEEFTIVVREDTRRIEEKKQQLEAERQRIVEDQKKLDDSLAKLKEGFGEGGDEKTRQLVDVVKRLQAENARLSQRLGEEMVQHSTWLDQQKQQLGSGTVAAAGSGGDAALRAELAGVKAQQAELARDLGAVRGTLGSIDAQVKAILAKLDNLPAGAGAAAPAPVVTSGKVVSKKVVDRANKGLSASMRKKGIKVLDLPAAYQRHPRDIRAALGTGDNVLAHELIQQLQAVVDDIKIDKEFIQAKMQRAQALAAAAKPSAETKAKIADKLKSAAKNFSDAKYVQANSDINELIALTGED